MAVPALRHETKPEMNEWEPVDEIDHLTRHLRSLWEGSAISRSGFIPLADIEETDDAYIVELDLPGVRRDDVSVELSGRRLEIRGERKEKERSGVLRARTRRVGQFSYEIVLPGEVDPEKVDAHMEDGTLVVRVPKVSAERPRRISVT
ncbi:MAG: heat shock protein Hsp20 [Acidimicrobiaceae bacterium]|jgi:HSP20 family protein|nr:heat shock protein Hsp20 [Acidimicrobiaceae bacterium]